MGGRRRGDAAREALERLTRRARHVRPIERLLATSAGVTLHDLVSAPRDLRAAFRTPGMIPVRGATLLYQLASEVKEGCIVEIGSYRGRSTIALARGAKAGANPPVFAIDPHEAFAGELGGRFSSADRAGFFRAMLRSGCYDNVRLVNLSSEVVTPGWTTPVGLLWIDGDHSFDGVSRDYYSWSDHLTHPATVAFDDPTSSGPSRLIPQLLQTPGVELLAEHGGIVALRVFG